MQNDNYSTAQKKATIKKILNSEFFDYVMIAIGMMGYGVSPPSCTGAWVFLCR